MNTQNKKTFSETKQMHPKFQPSPIITATLEIQSDIIVYLYTIMFVYMLLAYYMQKRYWTVRKKCLRS